jgi:hypothetical protein
MGLKTEPIGPFEKIKNNKRKRQIKYTNSCEKIDRILNNSRMRSHKKILILNGNISTQCRIKTNQ